jgi:general secretion pathway protein G
MPSGGFTLIEVMVVIVILGVLAALVVPRVLSRPDEARAVAARQDINVIGQALKLYRLDNQRFPTAEQGLAALVAKPDAPPVPQNWKPWRLPRAAAEGSVGQPLRYVNSGTALARSTCCRWARTASPAAKPSTPNRVVAVTTRAFRAPLSRKAPGSRWSKYW